MTHLFLSGQKNDRPGICGGRKLGSVDAADRMPLHEGCPGVVMPGLVPGIHAFFVAKTWMAGSSPAMTK
ncbi:MAG: hypothetical protein GY844_35965 [Bradyrhizobium sp.]|nr:hypothetical protein [Bradyrhizobium sp.]